jgi:hypothetical protein
VQVLVVGVAMCHSRRFHAPRRVSRFRCNDERMCTSPVVPLPGGPSPSPDRQLPVRPPPRPSLHVALSLACPRAGERGTEWAKPAAPANSIIINRQPPPFRLELALILSSPPFSPLPQPCYSAVFSCQYIPIINCFRRPRQFVPVLLPSRFFSVVLSLLGATMTQLANGLGFAEGHIAPDCCWILIASVPSLPSTNKAAVRLN